MSGSVHLAQQVTESQWTLDATVVMIRDGTLSIQWGDRDRDILTLQWWAAKGCPSNG